jgi:hypothetical protein
MSPEQLRKIPEPTDLRAICSALEHFFLPPLAAYAKSNRGPTEKV